MLPSSIGPDPLELFSEQKCSHGVDARPLEWARDEVLLAAVSEYVAQSSDLGRLLVADQDVLVATMPEGSSPSVKSPRLLREICLEVPDKPSQLFRILDRDQKVVVIRQHNQSVDSDFKQPLGST